MNIREAKELLPAYVMGTLSAGEKTNIEQLLTDSPELQLELQFHRTMKVAISEQAMYLQQCHLTSEQLVECSQRIGDGFEIESIFEAHLRSCDNCNAELVMAVESYESFLQEEKKNIFERLVKRFEGIFSSSSVLLDMVLKPVFAVPVLALVIIGLVVVMNNYNNKGQKTLFCTLEYQNTRQGYQPTILITDDIDTVAFSVFVERHEMALYSAEIVKENSSLWLGYCSGVQTPSGYDSLFIAVPVFTFNLQGEYLLRLKYNSMEIPIDIPFTVVLRR